jgi:hypothetical protein
VTDQLTQTAATEALRRYGSVRAAAASLGTTGHKLRVALNGTANVVFTATYDERLLIGFVNGQTRRRKGRLVGPSTETIAALLNVKVRAARARIQRAREKGYVETYGTSRDARHLVTHLGRKILRLPPPSLPQPTEGPQP